MGLLSVLFGCAQKASPFQKRDGAWFYHDTAIPGADASSFTALSEHYAKDKRAVYFADTYRKGQEYFSVAHDRIVTIADADPGTFEVLRQEYARDAQRVYRGGEPVAIEDPPSFELFTYGQFARDRIRAYCDAQAIPESDGATFAPLDDSYAKDVRHVYYCRVVAVPGTGRTTAQIVTLADANAATFSVAVDSAGGVIGQDGTHRYSLGQRLP